MPLDRIDGEIIFDIDYNSLHQALQATGWLTGWAVTGNAGTLSVDVAAGRGMAEGVLKETDPSTNVVLTAAHASNPRKDLIVYDRSASALAKVDGTAAAIEPDGEDNPRKMKLPAPPDLGATNDILIALVYVPAAATLGSQCTIIDKRVKLPLVYVPSQAQGDVWFYDGKKQARLAPDTAGLFLKTQGAAANPAWAEVLPTTVGDDLIASADEARSQSGTPYVKQKEFKVGRATTYRIKFELKASSAADAAYARIYKNGVAYGTERSTTSTTYVPYSEDLAFNAADLIQLYAHCVTPFNADTRNFRLYINLANYDEVLTLLD